MTRTTITKTGDSEVTLKAIDPWTDEPITRVFWTPTNWGYVREGDTQTCAGLETRGNTLTAKDGAELLTVIRAEWKTYRRAALRDRNPQGAYSGRGASDNDKGK
jgi:hypothetical protein